MKKISISILIMMIAGYCLYCGYLMYRNYQLQNSKDQRILLVYNKSSLRNSAYILKAYESVLIEEGIPFEKVEVHLLMKLSAKKIARNSSAIIFPDGLVQHIPEELHNWVNEYMESSGNIAVIYDAGIRTPRGYYLEKAFFAEIIGINYITYNKYRKDAYAVGSLKFASAKKADYFEIPTSSIDRGLFLISSPYGKLRFPIARCDYTKSIQEVNIFAYLLTQEGEKYPAILINKYGASNILYVNLPLGYINAKADNILLRHILKTFLVKTFM